jgi:hypothetical protein
MTRDHNSHVWGNPCSKRSAGPLPAVATLISIPLAETFRVETTLAGSFTIVLLGLPVLHPNYVFLASSAVIGYARETSSVVCTAGLRLDVM